MVNKGGMHNMIDALQLALLTWIIFCMYCIYQFSLLISCAIALFCCGYQFPYEETGLPGWSFWGQISESWS